jgi:hypothetical protein
MQALAQSVVEVFEGDATRAGHEKGRTLTCSEFVYRCFDEANESMKLAVARPLGRWPDPARLQSEASSDVGIGAGPGETGETGHVVETASQAGSDVVVDGEGLVDFDQSFRPALLGPYFRPSSSAGSQPYGAFPADVGGSITTASEETPDSELIAASQLMTAGLKIDMATMTGKVIVRLIRVNKQRKKYDQAASRKGDPLADLITPRDLWSSGSLSTIAVLHRPPSSSEEGLDQAHGTRGDD